MITAITILTCIVFVVACIVFVVVCTLYWRRVIRETDAQIARQREEFRCLARHMEPE